MIVDPVFVLVLEMLLIIAGSLQSAGRGLRGHALARCHSPQAHPVHHTAAQASPMAAAATTLTLLGFLPQGCLSPEIVSGSAAAVFSVHLHGQKMQFIHEPQPPNI